MKLLIVDDHVLVRNGLRQTAEALGRHAGSRDGEQALRPRSLEELDLTARQLQILRLLGQGKPNKVIARELDIAEAAVKVRITEAFRALRVTNRAQAAIAARTGFQ